MQPRNRATVRVAQTVAIVALAATAGAGSPDRKDLPRAVAQAIDENFPGAEIHKLTREKENGVAIYDIEFKANRGEMDLLEDGTVLDIATMVELKDVPEPAATIIQEAARGTRIKQLEKSEVRVRIEKTGTLSRLSPPACEYEAELAKGGEVEVAADGRIIKGPKSLRKSGPEQK
jgi:hypothetical protein